MSKATRKEVYAAIDSERTYQDLKWTPKTTTSDGQHSIEEWIVYMEDYLKEAKHILSRHPKQEADHEAIQIMRKVTAMGVAAMEQHGAIPR
jgi:hypothetical protein